MPSLYPSVTGRALSLQYVTQEDDCCGCGWVGCFLSHRDLMTFPWGGLWQSELWSSSCCGALTQLVVNMCDPPESLTRRAGTHSSCFGQTKVVIPLKFLYSVSSFLPIWPTRYLLQPNHPRSYLLSIQIFKFPFPMYILFYKLSFLSQ